MIFYGVMSNSDFIIGVGIIVMGVDVVLLPFTTPETITFLGVVDLINYQNTDLLACL